jgi:hypothetical protein
MKVVLTRLPTQQAGVLCRIVATGPRLSASGKSVLVDLKNIV